jgi:hypothetical protein
VADHIHFAEVRKVRARGGEVFCKRGDLHVAHRKGKSSPSRLALFPEKRLVENKPCRT